MMERMSWAGEGAKCDIQKREWYRNVCEIRGEIVLGWGSLRCLFGKGGV